MANQVDGVARPSNLVVFACLLGASIVAVVAMTPALLLLLDPARQSPFSDESIDPVRFVIGFAAINIVVSAIAIAVGLRLEPSVRMGVSPSWLAAGRTELRPRSEILLRCFALACGLAAIVLASAFAFRSQLPGLPDNFAFPPIWQGVLMMLGAAVREEILFRFFALSLFVWIAMKALRQREPTTAIIWTTNIAVALIFAVMHLLPAAQLLALNAIAVCIAIALACVASVLFGWVYWRHGLLMAMFTHAISSLLVYLGGRGLIALAS